MNQYNNERILQYMLSNVDSWDEEFFKSALDGVLIGLHYSMKSLVSLDKIDEVCCHLILNANCTHALHSAAEN